MVKAIARHKASSAADQPVHFYSSSGGNAGLACATAAISLKEKATIVVPFSTSEFMMQKLKLLGAHVVQFGPSWAEADKHLREVVMLQDEGVAIYVPPFDHEDLWEGAAGIVDELKEQLPEGYDAVVCSVGGGGLFTGIMQGLGNGMVQSGNNGVTGLPKVTVVAVETEGADSLASSLRAGEPITLPGITSIATSLGATRVAKQAFEYAKDDKVRSVVLSDAEAAMGTVRFADDQRIMVEVACGVSIALAYDGKLRDILGTGMNDAQWSKMRVVIVVCGGNAVSLDIIEGYRKEYGTK